MNEMHKYYKILEIQTDASMDEIKQAYRDLVKVWHPDRFSHDLRLREKAQEKLKTINIAYRKVLDYRERSSPDQEKVRADSTPSNAKGRKADAGPSSTETASTKGNPPKAEKGNWLVRKAKKYGLITFTMCYFTVYNLTAAFGSYFSDDTILLSREEGGNIWLVLGSCKVISVKR